MIHPVNLPVYMAPRASVYAEISGLDMGIFGGNPSSRYLAYLDGSHSYTPDGRRLVNGAPLNSYQPDDLWTNLFRRNFVSRMNENLDSVVDFSQNHKRFAIQNLSEPTEAEDTTDEAVRPPPRSLRFPQNNGDSFDSRKQVKTLELRWISLNINENTAAHHTDGYEITQKQKNPHLIIRRGQEFQVTLCFYRNFDPAIDRLKLVFELGRLPLESKRTRVSLHLDPRETSFAGWFVSKMHTFDFKMELTVKPSPNAPIGSWNMKLYASSKETELDGTESVWPVYGIFILFNPWCKDDSCFMEKREDREEYVLNDVGKIWRGTHNAVEPCVWSYGQFEEGILDACLLILDQSKLPLSLRDSPIEISRSVSQIVNNKDDRGVLVGNWDKVIVGGKEPTYWTGSVPILMEYITYGRPVKYGQCWVFAGVVTTVLRCLGIPCRTVTNYSSAHDTDTTCTVDIHFSEETGKFMKEYNLDSVWTFHVWNDCWMSRPDLPSGYGGWQAIDATPQEKSHGLYRAGPASVRAIKEGEVSFKYDSSFVFAEVNADKCFWVVRRRKEARLHDIKTNEIGRMIVTKKPGKHLLQGNDDMMDISGDYKHFEMTRAERLAVMNALVSGHSAALYDYQMLSDKRSTKEDIEFCLDLGENVMIGQDFYVSVWMTNRSQEIRTVKLSLRLNAIMYTGSIGKKVKSQSRELKLAPLESGHTVMMVAVHDYLNKLLDQASFLFSIMALVEETGQIYTETDDCRLLKPEVLIEVNKNPVVNEPFEIQLKAINPLPTFLTNCTFLLEGPGLLLPKEISCRNVAPRGLAKVTVTLRPWKRGERAIIAHFQADELHDVQGMKTVYVNDR